jgi:asparagine synthase (glutamine-hydrolysing)
MNSKLFHRGPDAQDVLLFDNVGFGFSRLSIIGVENGMQPIANEDGSILVICNGEIFNYIELRQELKSRGHRFQTSSDVEVLVHLYEEFGTGFLNKLTGQFAFALYDKTRKTLFCARDHMGIAPFFYTVAGNTFIFGSEIKAIIEHPLVVREIDMVGLDQVFTFAGLISPRTMFKGVRSLENGHYLTVDPKGEVSDVEYWDLIYPEGEMPMNGKPESFYIDRLEELFHRSVDLRLRTDVPFGLYLSGGLDSSLIAMKVNQLIPQNRKEAFSIDFIDSQLSESVYQKMVATESNSAINQKIFFYDDISHRLKKAVYHCECPLKESYNTASLSLSESVRSKGIKVILSGEGADEFFAGYVGYRFDKIRAMSPVGNAPGAAEQKLRRRLWGDGSFFYERNYLEFDAVKRSLYSDDVSHAFEEINCLNHFVVDETKLRNRNTMNKRSYIDYKLRLVDHLVSDHGDRMALANSVEVRYPFLDKDLVEFSTTIPADLKLNDLTEKYILKKLAARNSVPRAVVEREKFGFVAPGSPYLIQKGTEYVNDILSYDRISRQGYFNPEKVQELRKTYQQNGFKINVPFESDLLMTVITLGILLEEYF